MFVIFHGNPIDGHTVIGPFESKDKAIDAGDRLDGDWWISEVRPPARPIRFGRSLNQVDLGEAKSILSAVQIALWWDGERGWNPEKCWAGDELDQISKALEERGLRPTFVED